MALPIRPASTPQKQQSVSQNPTLASQAVVSAEPTLKTTLGWNGMDRTALATRSTGNASQQSFLEKAFDARQARREKFSPTTAVADHAVSATKSAPPAPLTESQMLSQASQFLASQGKTAKTVLEVRQHLQKNPELRRQFLNEQAQKDVNKGAMALETFANTVQLSRWLNTTQKGGKTKINGAEVGRDVGLVFAGTDEMMDGPKSRFDNRWNINTTNPGGKLPPTGFRHDMRNDDGAATEDQTHHLAFYTMVGATKDNIFGTMIGYAGAWWSDRGNPQDIKLGKLGVDFGRKIDDPKFDAHAWLWSKIGDPSAK